MESDKKFTIFVKAALVLAIFEIVMLFIVQPLSAEFYVLLLSLILLLGFIVYAIIKIRKDIKRGKE